MSMYSAFARWYDRIFPFSPGVYAFLTHYLGDLGGPVLDLGCGTGDYCAAFVRDGIRAVGLDLDEKMIAQARTRTPEAEFHVADMRRLHTLEGPWSMIFSIGNTAAHLPEPDLWACVDHVAERLLPQGIWILQVMNWDYILGLHTFTFPPKDMEGAVFHRAYTMISTDSLLFQTSLEIEGKRVFDDQVRLYPLPSERLVSGHLDRGFKLVRHVADYGGGSFDPDRFSANIFVFTR